MPLLLHACRSCTSPLETIGFFIITGSPAIVGSVGLPEPEEEPDARAMLAQQVRIAVSARWGLSEAISQNPAVVGKP